MPKYKLLVWLFTFIMYKCVSAQTTITGTVKDSKDSIIPYASIFAYTDSIVINGVISDSLGHFRIQSLIPIKRVNISASGYIEKDTIGSFLEGDIVIIVLQRQVESLTGVTVVGRKPLIERKSDRIIFNVENSLFSKGFDGVEILKRTPRMTINSDDQVEMAGRGSVRVMIDGKILELSERDLSTRLKSIRSENIAKIEVIPIPPSRYSAEGNIGMINIVMKKDALLGWQGYITGDYVQRVYPGFSKSGTINYKSRRLDISITAVYEYVKLLNVNRFFYDFGDKFIDINKNIVNRSSTTSSNGIFKYQLTKKIDIGGTYDLNKQNSKNEDIETSLYAQRSNRGNDSTLTSPSNSIYKPKTLSGAAYLDWKIDSLGKKFSLNYNHTGNSTSTDREIISNIYSPSQGDKLRRLNYNGDNDYNINSVLLDVELPTKFLNYETGFSMTSIQNDSRIELYNTIGNQRYLDSLGSNKFEYKERTASIYLSINKELSDKLSLKGGIRYERSKITGYSPTLLLTTVTEYNKFYPTLFGLYTINKKNSVSFAYSKRVDRPSFNDLNPFRYYTSVYNFTGGNAYLLPSFNDNIELSYSLKNNLNIIIVGSQLKRGIDYATSISSTGITGIQPYNIVDQKRLELIASYTFNFFKIWNSYNSANLSYTSSKTTINSLLNDLKGYGGTLISQNTFQLNSKRNLFAGIEYYHYLPSVYGLASRGNFGRLNANIRYAWEKKGITFRLSGTDIFKQNILVTTRYNPSFVNINTFNAKISNIYFTVSYSFGNKKVQGIYRDTKNYEKQRVY